MKIARDGSVKVLILLLCKLLLPQQKRESGHPGGHAMKGLHEENREAGQFLWPPPLISFIGQFCVETGSYFWEYD